MITTKRLVVDAKTKTEKYEDYECKETPTYTMPKSINQEKLKAVLKKKGIIISDEEIQ